MLVAALTALCVGLIFWFLVLPVIRQKAEISQFFDAGDLKQAGFFARFKLGLVGLKTKLWANFLILAGLLVPVLSVIPELDLTNILKPVHIPWADITVTPTQYVSVVVVPFIGWVTAKLREWTTAPVGVPSVAQVATIIPDAPTAIVHAKVVEIAEVKAAEVINAKAI
jgi:hypothetical protein